MHLFLFSEIILLLLYRTPTGMVVSYEEHCIILLNLSLLVVPVCLGCDLHNVSPVAEFLSPLGVTRKSEHPLLRGHVLTPELYIGQGFCKVFSPTD